MEWLNFENYMAMAISAIEQPKGNGEHVGGARRHYAFSHVTGPFYEKNIVGVRELVFEAFDRIFIVKAVALMNLKDGKIRTSRGSGYQVSYSS
jgi:hypothetical protein